MAPPQTLAAPTTVQQISGVHFSVRGTRVHQLLKTKHSSEEKTSQ